MSRPRTPLGRLRPMPWTAVAANLVGAFVIATRGGLVLLPGNLVCICAAAWVLWKL